MPDSVTYKAEPPARRNLIIALTVFISLVLVRWAWLQGRVVDIPYWDQWDAIMAGLFQRLHDGSFSLHDLIRPQNEHNILWTRLVAITEYFLNSGRFDNRITAVFNAIPYAASLVLFLWPLLKKQEFRNPAVLLVLVAGILPYSWQNMYVGFQNGFFFLNVFAILVIFLASLAALSYQNIAAIACISFLGLFTMATGFLAPCIALLIIYVRLGCQREQIAKLFITTGALGISIATGLWMALHPGGGNPANHAQSIYKFAHAAGIFLAWPLDFFGSWLCIVIWSPSIAIAAMQIKSWRFRALTDSTVLYLLAIAVWVAMQAVALAYGRGLITSDHVASRYMDILIFGVLANSLLLLWLVRKLLVKRYWKYLLLGYLAIYSMLFFVCIEAHSLTGYIMSEQRVLMAHTQTANLQDYLGSGYPKSLTTKRYLEIPYPSAKRLMMLLNEPGIIKSFPPSIAKPAFRSWQHCNGYAARGTYLSVNKLRFPANSIGTWARPKYNKNKGRCLSPYFKTNTPYLRLMNSGYLGRKDLSVALVDMQGHLTPFEIRKSPGEVWAPSLQRVRSGTYRMLLTDSSDSHWFAVAPPQPVGALSALIPSLLDHARSLLAVWFAILLTCALLAYALRKKAPPTLESDKSKLIT